jgi:hypothetical protein
VIERCWQTVFSPYRKLSSATAGVICAANPRASFGKPAVTKKKTGETRMDRDFGLYRPPAIAAVTMAQSAPGAWTNLAEFLFQPGRGKLRAATAEAPVPQPANDRYPASRRVGSPCLRLIGR